MTTDTITLPACWASALINDDWSGLDSLDCWLMLEWLGENIDMNFVDVGKPYFSDDMGDGSGLAGDVADYTVHIGEK